MLEALRSVIDNARRNRAVLEELAHEAAFALLSPESVAARQELAALCVALDNRAAAAEREMATALEALAEAWRERDAWRHRYEALHALVATLPTPSDSATLPLFESEAIGVAAQ